MKSVLRHALLLFITLSVISPWLSAVPQLAAEPLPLKRAVELALAHSTMAAAASVDEQRVFASYVETRDSYLPQVMLGSGLGKPWGYPLSLEGSAPSIFNLNAQSPLINFALRDFVRAAKSEYQATTMQSKDQRNQVIQDTVVSYVELSQWEAVLNHLLEARGNALKSEQTVQLRLQAGVENVLAGTQAQLTTARVELRITQAHAAIEELKTKLSHLTGLPADSIESVPDSIPPLPEVKQEDNLARQAAQVSPVVQAAEGRALALDLQARGQHKALWPTLDFAAQYALLATFDNYQQYFRPGSFQQHNATLGVVIRLPFLNLSQRAHAQAADAEALHAHKEAEAVKNQVSEEALKLERSVEELAAAQHVADLESQIAQANLLALETRVDSGTAAFHDEADARNQANERYNALQDSNFELQRARITLLRSTGDLEKWVRGEN